MIRQANLEDLNVIAKLHTESFEGHFLPKLGLKLLSNYYKEFLDDNNIFLVHVNERNKIDGLLLGTPDSSVGRNKFIKKNQINLSVKMLLLSLKFDKDTWVRIIGTTKSLLSKLFIQKGKDNVKRPNFKLISLLSICVSQDSKGKGISNILIEEFEKRLTKVNYEGYILTVHKMNNRANKFYRKIGMDIYRQSDSEYGYIKLLVNTENRQFST